jgi:hypothetical protein
MWGYQPHDHQNFTVTISQMQKMTLPLVMHVFTLSCIFDAAW